MKKILIKALKEAARAAVAALVGVITAAFSGCTSLTVPAHDAKVITGPGVTIVTGDNAASAAGK